MGIHWAFQSWFAESARRHLIVTEKGLAYSLSYAEDIWERRLMVRSIATLCIECESEH